MPKYNLYNQNRMCGIFDWIKLTPTEKAQTVITDTTSSVIKKYGLEAWFPGKTAAPPGPTIMGLDPKVLYIVGGALGLLVIVTALRKRKK